MAIDPDTLAALVDKSVSDSMQKNMAQFQESQKLQADRMEELMGALFKKQEAHEVKSDERLSRFEKTLIDRQDNFEHRNDDRLLVMEKQLSCINDTIAGKASSTLQFPPLLSRRSPSPQLQTPPDLMPPHPTTLPRPEFSNLPFQPHPTHPLQHQQQPQLQQHSKSSDLTAIQELVSEAATILGLGPISSADIEDASGDTPDKKIFAAVIDFLRKEIAVKESEISDGEIIKVFASEDPELQRVYVQFSSREKADLCMNLTRRLRQPELNVVLYVPRHFKQRFHAIKSEDYRLRKLTQPRHRTRIEYSDSDLVLFVCPAGYHRFVLHPVPGLPPVDFAPVRTPPQGRKQKKGKRDRSESASPNAEPKNLRVESPVTDVTKEPSSTDQSVTGLQDITEQHLN